MASSACTRPASRSPTSPTSGSTRSSTAARSRPGIASSDGETITVVKDMGLVTQVFDERRLAPLDGHLAIGHVRYSTTGSSTWRNAQPVYRSVADAGFCLGHNGNLTNTEALAGELGMLPGRAHVRQRADRRAAGARVHRHAALRRSRPRARARTGAADVGRRVLARVDGRGARVRRARPSRLPAAGARSHRRRLGARERDVPRSTSSARTSSATSSRASWSRSTPPAFGRSASPSPTRSCACSSSSTSRVPTRSSTARACTARASAWARSWRARRRASTPTW